MEWKSTRLKLAMLYCLSIFFFFSACALFCTISTRTTHSDIRSCLLTGKADLYFQDVEKKIKENNKEENITVSMGRRGVASRRLTRRRYLSGPGSSPPRCTSKCGKCKPCKPVHVPVPPGTPVTAEYYPEAWRCKCGGKLYMP